MKYMISRRYEDVKSKTKEPIRFSFQKINSLLNIVHDGFNKNFWLKLRSIIISVWFIITTKDF